MRNWMAHILVVDDDNRIRSLLQKYLAGHNFRVTTADSAASARTALLNESFDIAIFDVMMPGESGLELLEFLRSNPSHPAHDLPIMILTAKGDTPDRIKGLEIGADDYIAKPFDPKELFLRIITILRRVRPKVSRGMVQLGEYSFDVQRGLLYKGENPVLLTYVEKNLLKVMAQSPGNVCSREELSQLGGVVLSPRTVDVQVTRLRKKIEENPKEPIYIQTVRHKGYVLWPD